MINSSIKQEVEYLIQENQSLSIEKENIKIFLNGKNISNTDIKFYAEKSKYHAIWGITFILIFSIIYAGILYALGTICIFLAIIFLIFSFESILEFFNMNDSITFIPTFIIILLILNGVGTIIPLLIIILLLGYYYFTQSDIVESSQNFVRIENHIENNHNRISHLLKPNIIALVHRERMADVNSIHAHGFSFLPAIYIHDILNQHLHEIEKIPLQNNTILYKSKINSF